MSPIRLLLAALFLSGTAFAADNRGPSAIGLCNPHFDCKGFIGTFDRASVIRTGWFDNTFADNCACGAKVLSLPKPKEIRLSFNWRCFTAGKCQKHDVFYGYTKDSAIRAIRKGEKKLLDRMRVRYAKSVGLLQNRSGLTFRVNTCIECVFPADVRRSLNEVARPYFSNVPGFAGFVDNPLHSTGPCMSGYQCEIHGDGGPRPPPYIIDNDGTEVKSLTTFKARNASAIMALLWYKCMNGLENIYVYPRQRTNFCGKDKWNIYRGWNAP